ncbi:MAG: energy transducer TonB, partial [Balneolaceae bacterium]
KGIQEQLNYPEFSKEHNLGGRVVVKFIVDEKGNVKNPEIKEGAGAEINAEVLRVIKMAKFIPAYQDGKPIQVEFTLPVNFKL